MTRICVSIIEDRPEASLEAARIAVSRGADLVEFRFDMMKVLPSNISFFNKLPIPKIATLRTVQQGGKFNGNEHERLLFFQSAIRGGFEYIDLELDSPLISRREMELKGSKIICSYHDLSGTPSANQIVDILVRCAAKGDVPKAAFKVGSLSALLDLIDAARLFSFTEKDFSLIGMGELGELTRVCASEMGVGFTYASLERGKEAAPGQVDIQTMKRLSEERVVTGIVGNPLSHTLSPAMHNAAFATLGIPGRYVVLPTFENELETLLQVAVELRLRGFNVTIPHKQSILPLLDRLDPSAERIGAVNTVLIEDGQFIGYNTDVYGATMALRSAGVEGKGLRALVIGAGGASRAVVGALSDLGAKIFICNRTKEKAETLTRSFKNTRSIEVDDAQKDEFDIVVNCTPLGMVGFPDELPIGTSVFRAGQIVMDTIYNPPKTKFLAEAERKGAITINGEGMLVHQGLKAFEIFTAKQASYEVMLNALRGVSY
jgi:shikimate dehydrogenase/3-dehydroquinate dehydratase type I